ncbi:hypothetical protein LL240_07015 [Oceanimonas baumannii]|uniref:hypothetical protein n=1 Tax=Oceanimonas baumannii TaxID=129578 RepID=UPI001D186BCE|nr:hypothetical protein [Oceanimonas baumannii]MCC4264203.1 hypothetical protein [Oceanimonas baumannii]
MSKKRTVTVNILAFLIFGLGLLSPLTPSTGMPGIGSLIIYVGLPLILLLNAWRGYSHQMAKYVVVLQGLCILAVTGWLLLLQAGIFSNAG